MRYFDQATLRLKQQLGLVRDKQIAAALGMGEKAFNARKARGSFPEKELRALAQQRPELGIDVEWVLGSKRGFAAQEVHGQFARLKEALGLREDQEAAAVFGMHKAAFSARKKRGTFPVKELRALAQQRPELGIDVEWVLTGEPGNVIGMVSGGHVRQVRVGSHGGWPASPVSPAARLRQTASELAAQADEVLAVLQANPGRHTPDPARRPLEGTPAHQAHLLTAYYLCRGTLEVLREALRHIGQRP